jgi:hypothetical protein
LKRETIYTELSDSTLQLLNQVRSLTFNHFSNTCLYILTEITNIDKNYINETKIRINENKGKLPQPLHQIVQVLEKMYSDLYDVNLYVYKAKKEVTIVEVQYFLRSSIDLKFRDQCAEVETMLHSKVCLPPYFIPAATSYTDYAEKFDIHWQFGTLNHKWRMFWWSRRVNSELSKRELNR